MGKAQRFTQERRELWFRLVESGETQEAANREVGVSPTTVARWRAKGRQELEGDAFEFAKRLDAVSRRKPKRAAKDVVADVAAGRVQGTDEELEQLLIKIAFEENSVPAVKYLREMRRERNEEQAEAKKPLAEPDFFDELAERRSAQGA